MTAPKVAETPLAKLKPAPWNPRTIREERFKNLCASIEADPEFLWRRPVLAMLDGTIYAGNMRYRAAAHLGRKSIPAIVEDVPEGLAKERALRDNAQWGDWNDDQLAEMVYQMAASGSDVKLLGIEEDELARLLGLTGVGGTEGLTDPDELPENVPTRSKRGDLWLLGEHRVLCGDSTDPADVARLMNGAKAGAVFTSPPYDQQRTYEDNMAADWVGLMTFVADELQGAVDPAGQIFVNLGLIHRDGRVIRYWDAFLTAMDNRKWPLFGWYVWDKLNGMPGDWNGRLAPSHEWVFHFAREHERPGKVVVSKSAGVRTGKSQRNPDGSMKRFTGDGDAVQPTKIPDSVVRLANQGSGGIGHVAPFPVGLPTVFISAWRAASWLDPFLGSGTTLIACEQLGRKCYGLEIEPKYVDVILQRWENFTGKTAVLDGGS